MKEIMIKTLTVFMVVVLFFSLAFSPSIIIAEAKESDKIESETLMLSDYEEYLSNNIGTGYANTPIEIPLQNSEINLVDETVVWSDGKGDVTFNFEANEDALYNIEVVWKALETGVDFEIGVKFDGDYPYEALKNTVLSRMWKNSTDTPIVDAKGNQYAPEQIEVRDYVETVLQDTTGVSDRPYLIAVSKGAHTVTLSNPEQPIVIKSIKLIPPEQPKKYSAEKIKKTDARIIEIQGESATLKNSNNIIPKSDNRNAGMTPVDSFNQKINYIGGTSWQSPGDKIEWNFTVQTEGYYNLAIRYKQSDLINGNSLRLLKIDNKIPFKEAEELYFPYGTNWEYFVLGDEKPYYIYLEEGNHTVSLEVTVGEQSQFVSRLSKIVEALGDEYINIIMITSETPDMNMDYELFKKIPNYNENLTVYRDELKKLADDMRNTLEGGTTQCIASIENMARVLNNMLRSPYIAQQYVKSYYSSYTSLSSWLHDMIKMPLAIDEIQFVPAGKEYVNKDAGFLKSLIFGINKFLISFSSDYQSAKKNDGKEGDTVRLWVNWGQDQAAALDSIIKDSFTTETGINVKLEIVNASLINGILSGNFPDVSLHMSRTAPVNLGIRGALTDLKQFDDYKEVLERFQSGAEIPYTYDDALYALPDTQSYFLMFYRTDVFETLELNVPRTWDEFIYAATVIQRNSMNVYVPYTQIVSTGTVDVGIGNLNLLPTMLAQNGLSLYNDELNATVLDSDDVLNVIKQWTSLYSNYDFLKEADFYNRFRMGSMPLGIAPFATYMNLSVAAPEIKGRWAVDLVPGTVGDDGSINRSVAGSGTGCGIVDKSSHKDSAWEFLKWWTSADAQERYINNVESVIGMTGRTATSNIEAFEALAWNGKDINVLKRQWENVKEVPEVPGSYYLTRSVDQIFWSIVNKESNPKNAVAKWSSLANAEINRKINEYNMGSE